MYREFAVCFIYYLLVKEVYSRSIQPVCNVKKVNLYILESYRLHIKAKSLSNQCIEEYKQLKINENYCISNSIQGLKGTLERTADISGSGEFDEENRGCTLSFNIQLEEGNHKVLGGDLSLYKLPPNNDEEDSLTLAIIVYYTDSNGVIHLVATDTINTKDEKGWKVFQVNDYARGLQYGDYKTKLSVSVKTDKTLSCEEMQYYFIFSCSAPKISNDVPNYNLVPMLTLFTETKKTILSKAFEGRKRREVSSTTHCRLEPHFIKLSDIRVLSVDHHLIEDAHINIGACVPEKPNINYVELDATSNHGWLHHQLSGGMYRSLCTPSLTQDMTYIVEEKHTGTFTSQILSDAVAIQC